VSRQPLSPRALGALIDTRGVTTMWLTSSLFNVVIDSDPSVLKPLRRLLVGGEPLSPRHIATALGVLSDTAIINGYGPTECTVFTCCYPIPRDTAVDTSIPIGRPVAETEVYVLDGEMRRLPPGMAGEIWVGGPGVARGYLERPELTAARFMPNPFATAGERLYRTGDFGRYHESGIFEFVGRVDRQIKLRGFRIELEEIEAAIRRHESVRHCVVLRDAVHPDNLVAYVVPASQTAPPDVPELKRHLRASLPSYMVPARVLIAPDLPLNSNGKLDVDALTALGGQGSFEDDERDLRPAAGAGTDARQLVLEVWRKTLGITDIDIDQNFFDIGGSSLTIIKVHEGLTARFGDAISLVEMFEYTTVASLSQRLSEHTVDEAR
jgi:acyl-coenzyme A synthetase/AMP-(fatty) acid ligase